MAKTIVLYGNQDCPSCVAAKQALDELGVKYAYIDILSGLGHLKRFLSLREARRDVYEAIIADGLLGIPTLLVDNQDIYVDIENMDLSFLTH